MTQLVLDACCGSRMMWFDREFAGAIYGDRQDARDDGAAQARRSDE